MGSRGEFLGFQGDRPGKRGRGRGKDADSTEGHPLPESLLPSPCFSVPRSHLSGSPWDPPVLTRFPGSLS